MKQRLVQQLAAPVLAVAFAMLVSSLMLQFAGYGAGKRPRSATIVITKNDGGKIGT